MKRNKIIALSICVILTLVLIQLGVASASYPTPQDALKYAKINSSKFKQSLEIIDDEKFIYALFITENNKVGAASLDHTMFGWRLDYITGMFDFSSIPKNSGHTGWSKHGERLLYGVINDNRIDSILVNNNSAKILNLENDLKLWYTIEPNNGPYDLIGIDRNKNIIHKINM
ncbi:MAG: hypothetical protein RO469_07845 [Thermincola sp.]|jgi:hypothetical protein|nr:hypothetical protein [Thermincola sp.]